MEKAFAWTLLACVVCTACSPGKRTIGVSVQSLKPQFYQAMIAAMKREAKGSYTLVVHDADGDEATQLDDVEDFISGETPVSAIVLTPVNSQDIAPAVLEANAANVPVFDADIGSVPGEGNIESEIASDNVKGGADAGDVICGAVGSHATVAVIDEPEVTSVQDRVRGFTTAMHRRQCRRIKVLSSVDAGGSSDKAYYAVLAILEAHPEIEAIFAINDDSAFGTARAVKKLNLDGKIKIVGYDATCEARDKIDRGEMYADVIQYPDQIGRETVDTIQSYFITKKALPKVRVPVAVYAADRLIDRGDVLKKVSITYAGSARGHNCE